MKIATQILKIGIIATIGASLVACSTADKQARANIYPRQQQCSVLKNQLTLNQKTPGVSDAEHQNITQQAEGMQLYNKYGCGGFEGDEKKR